jgi:hypothetical protein
VGAAAASSRCCTTRAAMRAMSAAFEGKDRTRGAATDRRQQPLKARPSRPAPGAAEIVINDNHVLPAEGAGARREGVLASPALRIVQELIHAGLPHVDIGVARQGVGVPPTGGDPMQARRGTVSVATPSQSIG